MSTSRASLWIYEIRLINNEKVRIRGTDVVIQDHEDYVPMLVVLANRKTVYMRHLSDVRDVARVDALESNPKLEVVHELVQRTSRTRKKN